MTYNLLIAQSLVLVLGNETTVDLQEPTSVSALVVLREVVCLTCPEASA